MHSVWPRGEVGIHYLKQPLTHYLVRADELAGRPRHLVSRKVRTSQSRVIANGNPRRLAGKCHRKQTAATESSDDGEVRVKRCGKSAPAFRVTGVAR